MGGRVSLSLFLLLFMMSGNSVHFPPQLCVGCLPKSPAAPAAANRRPEAFLWELLCWFLSASGAQLAGEGSAQT